jgi:hypothetical protein
VDGEEGDVTTAGRGDREGGSGRATPASRHAAPGGAGEMGLLTPPKLLKVELLFFLLILYVKIIMSNKILQN